MKFSSKLLSATSVAFCLGLAATSAQAETASAESKADIIEPNTVSKVSDLQFGDIISGSSASTIIVNPITEGRLVATGDAVAFGGTISAAEFQVDAQPLILYQIVLPTSATITRSGGSETMLVDNFTLDGLPVRFLPLLTSVGNFKVGGTLNVGPDQQDGAYEGSFAVTVNYL